LSSDLQARIGSHPLLSIHLEVDGKPLAWSSADTAVTVSIPYEPTSEERNDTDKLVIWYINGQGEAEPVQNGHFDSKNSQMVFKTGHFSTYAVAYVQKSFKDLSRYPWAKQEIEALAAKGIVEGISADRYSPGLSITRADFLVLLTQSLELTAAEPGSFADVKPDAYYYEAVGIGKALGITLGSGSGRFEPLKPITREDAMVLLNRALAFSELK
ncbi:S-layer homology domain-containing protein, partial [Paenibacillus sepulcri]|nr:S-layer homology domain-containing protein [Paenibacillus sepulcri]